MKKTLFPIPKDLLHLLRNANSEDTVRQLVLQQLDYDEIKLGASRSDALHKNILSEFKHKVNLQNPYERAKVLAQALYYCNSLYVDGRIEDDGTGRVPPYVALIDHDEFVFYERENLKPIYTDVTLFRQGTPSSPDEAVIEKCLPVVYNQYIFVHTPADLDCAIRRLREIVHSEILVVEDITEYHIFNLYSSWGNKFDEFLNQKGRENKPHVFRKDCHEKDSDAGREIFGIYPFDSTAALPHVTFCPFLSKRMHSPRLFGQPTTYLRTFVPISQV